MEYEIGVLYMHLGDEEGAEKYLQSVSENSLFHQAAQALLGQLAVEKPSVEESLTTGDEEPAVEHPINPVEKRIRDIVGKYRIELSLALALMKQESNMKKHAVSRVGAAGLCQIMPATGRDLGLKIPNYRDAKKPKVDPEEDERFEPYKCMDAGFSYLRQLLNRYDDNVPLALSAYNAGMGRTKSRVARISETTAYVSDIMTYYWRYQDEAALEQAIAQLVAGIQAEG
jgi:soluble lytic murein transglycosylase-like protein